MKHYFIRLLYMLLGLILYGLGIVITLKANIGYAPWEVFHVGFAVTTGLSIGVSSIITGVVIVIIVTVLGEKFGIGTILSMILTGVFIDLFIFINFIPLAKNYPVGIVMLIIGLFVISLGSYFYMKSAFGIGPRDNLMVVLVRYLSPFLTALKGRVLNPSHTIKIPVGVCRSVIELLMTFIGWLLGGMVGIGTVISVIAIGFCIQVTFKALKFDVTAVKHESLKDTYNNLFGKK
jgi:uncharacterized membrane protein YczE